MLKLNSDLENMSTFVDALDSHWKFRPLGDGQYEIIGNVVLESLSNPEIYGSLYFKTTTITFPDDLSITEYVSTQVTVRGKTGLLFATIQSHLYNSTTLYIASAKKTDRNYYIMLQIYSNC